MLHELRGRRTAARFSVSINPLTEITYDRQRTSHFSRSRLCSIARTATPPPRNPKEESALSAERIDLRGSVKGSSGARSGSLAARGPDRTVPLGAHQIHVFLRGGNWSSADRSTSLGIVVGERYATTSIPLFFSASYAAGRGGRCKRKGSIVETRRQRFASASHSG